MVVNSSNGARYNVDCIHERRWKFWLTEEETVRKNGRT